MVSKKDLRCKECDSTLTYVRKDKSNKDKTERVCRHCGHVEKLKVKEGKLNAFGN